MATDNSATCLTFISSGDLSTGQFKFVKFSATDTVALCSALTDVPCGVLQNAPDAAGKPAVVCVFGQTKVSSDAALAAGALIGPSADAQADARVIGTDITHYVVGQVSKASGAAGEMAEALINCLNPHRAA